MEKHHVMNGPLAVALLPENKPGGSEDVSLEKQARLDIGFVPPKELEELFQDESGGP